MTNEQIDLMLAAARLGRWQRQVAEQGILELWKNGKMPNAPEGISDPRWRGMLVRILLDRMQTVASSA